MITDEQIKESIERKDALFFTDKEIETIWKEASTKSNIELLTLKNAYHSGFLEAMYLKAFKVDHRKAEKINDIKVYLLETIQLQKINNLQAELITSLNLKLFEKEIRNRELEETVERFKQEI